MYFIFFLRVNINYLHDDIIFLHIDIVYGKITCIQMAEVWHHKELSTGWSYPACRKGSKVQILCFKTAFKIVVTICYRLTALV